MPRAPGRHFYGWAIAIELSITQLVTWGIVYYAFSVFLVPMELALGWSRGALTGAFSAGLLMSGALTIPVGFWLDRHGPRLLMTAGVVVAAVLVYAWSRVSDLLALYLIWIGLGACMAAILYEPAFAVVARWFRRRRSVALAVVTFVAGFASTVFLPLSNWLIEQGDWRSALRVLALILVAVAPVHALILRRRPEDVGQVPDGYEYARAAKPTAGASGAAAPDATPSALLEASSPEAQASTTQASEAQRSEAERPHATADVRRSESSAAWPPGGGPASSELPLGPGASRRHTVAASAARERTIAAVLREPTFWWLTAIFFLAGMAAFGVRVHLVSLLLDRGFNAAFAAAATGAVGASQVAGRVLFAPAANRVPLRLMLAVIFGLQLAALLALLALPTTAGVWIVVVALGAANGAATLARPALIADLYGSEAFARISSVMVVFLVLAVTVGPAIIGWMFSAAGSYGVALWWAVAVSALAVVGVRFVHPSPVHA